MEGIATLQDCHGIDPSLVGGKANNLSRLINYGFKVPKGICVTTEVYKDFTQKSGILSYISYELGRKPIENMRWEEMWDASLRIRNKFLRAEVPEDIRQRILLQVRKHFEGQVLAIRSSSNFEDSPINSYAGLHESYLNIQGEEEILKHVKLVWSSLWSDAAIAYSKELSLDQGEGKMAVVIQEMLPGEISGVAFGESPLDKNKSIIEAVHGLNQGLVDGDVEPDRWVLDRKTGKVNEYFPAKERKKTVGMTGGTKIIEDTEGFVLKQDKIEELYYILVDLERKMGFIPDLEWTSYRNEIYLLQVRPISTSGLKDNNERRKWDMSLRRSFDNLKDLSSKITDKLMPELLEEARELENYDIEKLDNNKLAFEVERRKKVYEKWKNVYWEEFIPFAHGVRLFGEVYNDKIHPEDPYEFIDLLTTEEIVSVKRNKKIEQLAIKYKTKTGLVSSEGEIIDPGFNEEINDLIEDFPGVAGNISGRSTQIKTILSLMKIAGENKNQRDDSRVKQIQLLENNFFKSFPTEEKTKAKDLLSLAKLSYKLRDDDNVYLGKIENQFLRAMSVSKHRLGEKCHDEKTCQAVEEVILALKVPGYQPKEIEQDKGQDFKARAMRQMRGQPAGKGIARGPAKIIIERGDLFKVQQGDIIVCDSIDPEMTFIISAVSGIVERRGGMLVHGAIIAREYGIPCVTGVQNATENISNGDDITVDGYYGLVINHSVKQKK